MKISTRIGVYLVLALLLAPHWLNYVKIIKIKPLFGAYIKKEVESLHYQNWFNLTFQESLEKYLLTENALSAYFIRVYNQIDYAAFGEVHMAMGVLGKNNYLYDKVYLDTYYGKDKIADSLMKDYAYKFRFVSDTLKKLNKKILYIQCPGKASYYPEFIPDSLQEPEDLNSNYYSLLRHFQEQQIELIDFRKHFLAQKSSTPYPLFTQTGVHWSEYGIVLAMDSLINYLSHEYKRPIPKHQIDKVNIGYAKDLDVDVEKVLNLMYRIKGPKYAYPEKTFIDNNEKKIKLLMVCDSYMGNLYDRGLFKSFDPYSQFWFYYKSIRCSHSLNKVHILQVSPIEEVLKHDLIIVSATEPGLQFTSWDFINDLYGYFKSGTLLSKKKIGQLEKAYDLKKTLEQDNSVSDHVNKIMKEFNVSYDSALVIKCIWDNEKKQFKSMSK